MDGHGEELIFTMTIIKLCVVEIEGLVVEMGSKRILISHNRDCGRSWVGERRGGRAPRKEEDVYYRQLLGRTMLGRNYLLGFLVVIIDTTWRATDIG